MTISVTVSVNGNYKCPVTYKQGDREYTLQLSGREAGGRDERIIPFGHGSDVMTLTIGPEEPDNDV